MQQTPPSTPTPTPHMAAAMPKPKYTAPALQGPWNPLWGNVPQAQSPFAVPEAVQRMQPHHGVVPPAASPVPSTDVSAPIPTPSLTPPVSPTPMGASVPMGTPPQAAASISPPPMEPQPLGPTSAPVQNVAPPQPVGVDPRLLLQQPQEPIIPPTSTLMGSEGNNLGSALTGFF